MPEQPSDPQHHCNAPPRPSRLSPVKSVLAAMLGVQKQSEQEKDFESADAVPFIVTGVLLTIGLVLGVVVLVNWVLAN